jgi:hypothetical protein
MHGLFNGRKLSGKPRRSFGGETVIFPDVLEGPEFCLRDAPAVLGQLDEFLCVLLGNATIPLASNPFICRFQQRAVVADSVNRLVVALGHASSCFWFNAIWLQEAKGGPNME